MRRVDSHSFIRQLPNLSTTLSSIANNLQEFGVFQTLARDHNSETAAFFPSTLLETGQCESQFLLVQTCDLLPEFRLQIIDCHYCITYVHLSPTLLTQQTVSEHFYILTTMVIINEIFTRCSWYPMWRSPG
eukprot:g41613.t1